MKRLILVGLVGLSLTACANSTEEDLLMHCTSNFGSVGEDFKICMREMEKIEEIEEIEEIGKIENPKENEENPKIKFALNVVDKAVNFEDLKERLKNYESHKSGAYDSLTWNLGDNITITARNSDKFGFHMWIKHGYREIKNIIK